MYTKYAQMSQSTHFTAELLRPSIKCPPAPARLVSPWCTWPRVHSCLCAWPLLFLWPMNGLLPFLFAVLTPLPATAPSPPRLQHFLLFFLQGFLQQPFIGGTIKFRHCFNYIFFVLLAIIEETLLSTKIGSPFRKILVLYIILLSHPIWFTLAQSPQYILKMFFSGFICC